MQHAHPECGNGVTWSLEVRRGATRQRLAAGSGARGERRSRSGRSRACRCGPATSSRLSIGPRDGNHSCDLTAVDLTLARRRQDVGPGRRRLPRRPGRQPPRRPPRQPGRLALLHRARSRRRLRRGDPRRLACSRSGNRATSPEQKQPARRDVQTLLTSGPPAAKDSPDAQALPPARLAPRPAPPRRREPSWRRPSGDATCGPRPRAVRPARRRARRSTARAWACAPRRSSR